MPVSGSAVNCSLIYSKKKDVCIEMRRRVKQYVDAKLEEDIIPTKADVKTECNRIKEDFRQRGLI